MWLFNKKVQEPRTTEEVSPKPRVVETKKYDGGKDIRCPKCNSKDLKVTLQDSPIFSNSKGELVTIKGETLLFRCQCGFGAYLRPCDYVEHNKKSLTKVIEVEEKEIDLDIPR